MATIQSVQSGSETIVAGGGLVTTITLGSSVTLAQSYLVCTWLDNDGGTRERRHLFTEELSSTTITLTRNQSTFGASVTCEWYVYEFDSSVTVQRGIFTPSTISDSQTITAVNLSSTFVTASFSSTADGMLRWTVDLTTTTNIDFDSVSSVTADEIAYQVVEFDNADADVQVFTGQIASPNTSKAITITSVTVADTFIGSEFGFSASTFAPAIRHRDSCLIDSSTQITVNKDATDTGSAYNYAIYVVEMLDGSTVQSGTATIADTATGTTATITALTNGGMIQGSTGGNQVTDATSTSGLFPNDFRATQSVSGTTVTFTRAGTTAALEIEWFAVEWNASAATGRIMGSLAGLGGLAGPGGLAGSGGGMAG